MESQSSAVDHHGHVTPPAGDKGLKEDAIGFWDALVVGIASTAPAYSLAAVIGIVVVGVGLQAPGVLLVSFVPMFLIAAAFYYMNRADPDCGTNFSWITRAIGPSVGWVAGFAVCTTGLIVIGSLADVAAYYMFDIVSWDSALPTFEEGEPVSERDPDHAPRDGDHHRRHRDLRDRHRALRAHVADHDRRPGRRAAAVRGRRAGQGVRRGRRRTARSTRRCPGCGPGRSTRSTPWCSAC